MMMMMMVMMMMIIRYVCGTSGEMIRFCNSTEHAEDDYRQSESIDEAQT